MSLGIIIASKRFGSLSKRALYLESEKKKVRDQGRVNYIASGGGERVARLWGKLPDGKVIAPGVDIGSALLLNVNLDGRKEVFELLVSAEKGANEKEAIAAVEKIVDKLMAKYFPNVYWIAARHGDGACVHCHVACRNDSLGYAIDLTRGQFMQIRRDIAIWSGLDIKAAWPGKGLPRIGRPAERRFALLKKQQMEEEIEQGRLRVHKRNKKTNEIKTLEWQEQGKTNVEIIRFWVAARLQSRLDYALTEVEIAISIWHAKQDRAKINELAQQQAKEQFEREMDAEFETGLALLPPNVDARRDAALANRIPTTEFEQEKALRLARGR